jgi:hypothetical protein
MKCDDTLKVAVTTPHKIKTSSSVFCLILAGTSDSMNPFSVLVSPGKLLPCYNVLAKRVGITSFNSTVIAFLAVIVL